MAEPRPRITGNTKLSEALKAHPDVLEYIISLNPHDFQRLRNQVMYKVMPPRISLKRIAIMVGMPESQLVGDIIRIAGYDVEENYTDEEWQNESQEDGDDHPDLPASAKEPPSWMRDIDENAIKWVDLQEIDEKLEDPMPPINVAVNLSKPGETIGIIHKWEPQPLYDIWAMRGFEFFAKKINEDRWHVFVHRPVLYMVLCLLSLFTHEMALARTFKQALPGYVYSFPRDHASHEDFKTEWWYYTGHLKSESGKRFGYELTFFRSGIEHELPENKNVRNVYLAHFALTEESGRRFKYFEKISRSGLPVANARSDVFYVTNQGWSAEAVGDKFFLKADAEGCGIHLLLTSLKKPVVHGKDGVSQKASCKGCASHYYSLTRLKTEGTLLLDGKAEKVTGLSWMDHEFGSNQLTEEQVGWDWYSVQLDDNSELMIYVMRRRDGSIDKNSAGTIVKADGSIVHLNATDFKTTSKSFWTSPKSKGKYPVGWTIEIPQHKIVLNLDPVMEDQELVTTRSTGVTYWEGSANVAGTINGKAVRGQSYVEMTGYAEAFRKNI